MKLPQVFLPQHLALVSLRDFVKLIVGAFFIFLIKMSWKKKKISTASLEQAAAQVCSPRADSSSASQEPTWPSYGQIKNVYF